jgi:hypothetical protein
VFLSTIPGWAPGDVHRTASACSSGRQPWRWTWLRRCTRAGPAAPASGRVVSRKPPCEPRRGVDRLAIATIAATCCRLFVRLQFMTMLRAVLNSQGWLDINNCSEFREAASRNANGSVDVRAARQTGRENVSYIDSAFSRVSCGANLRAGRRPEDIAADQQGE